MNLATKAFLAAHSIQSFYLQLDEGLNGKPLHRMTKHHAIKCMEETGKGVTQYSVIISHKRVVAELIALGFNVESFPTSDELFTISCN